MKGLFLLVILGLACTSPEPDSPTRLKVVSLAPNLTEIVYALNRGELLIGVTAQCDYPPEAKERPKVGDYARPSLERILKLKPDLVLAALPEHRIIAGELRSLGLRVLEVWPQSLDGILRGIETIAQGLGAIKEGDSLTRALAEALNQLPTPPDTPRVYLEISATPLISVGGSSFLNDLVMRAGGKNIFAEIHQDYPIVSSEAVIRRDPEVILLLHSQATRDMVADRLGWERTSAVRSGRVYSGLNPDLFLRPGPRVVLGCKELFDLLH